MNRRRFCQGALSAAVAASLPASQGFAALLNASTVVTDINARTGSGADVTIPKAAVEDFGKSLLGQLLLPDSDGYDDARRVLNASIDKYPALIAQCAGAADVQSAVNFARSENLLLAVKCGGHSASGKSTCNGGLMIDLSPMRGARVDPSAQTAVVAGGAWLRDLDHEAMAHGLVTTAGTVSHTGVGGLTTGGGFGRLGRRFGLTLDNLVAVDMINADGEFRHASAEENPDLFWAVRGGGGNFGVVTAFKFKLHPMQKQVISASYAYSAKNAKSMLEFFGEYCDKAPDTMQVDGGIMAGEGAPGPVIGMAVCYSGPHDQAEELLAPLDKAGEIVNKNVQAMDYTALQKSRDQTDFRSNGSYLKSGFTSTLQPELISDLVDGFEADPRRSTRVVFQQSGGAIGRVAQDATAFANRDSKHNMLCVVGWKIENDPTDHVNYIRSYWDRNLDSHIRGFYINDQFDENQQSVNANFRTNYPRLVKIKKKYDPTNLFRLNANINPNG